VRITHAVIAIRKASSECAVVILLKVEKLQATIVGRIRAGVLTATLSGRANYDIC
jgi:hypothetical protein